MFGTYGRFNGNYAALRKSAATLNP